MRPMNTLIKLGVSFSADECWRAVVDRDPAADGSFYYSVKTTGIYCRNTCSARLPLRDNVQFHDSCEAAERAGFRACRRCHPNSASLQERQTAIVVAACRLIESADRAPSLNQLAQSAGLSASHFQRLFKSQTGVTPKAYSINHRATRLRGTLPHTRTVTQAIYGSGFQSNSRFYETAKDQLGMTPTTFRAGGSGTSIRFAVSDCWLGCCLVAASQVGICALLLGENCEELTEEIQLLFPEAELIGDDPEFDAMVKQVIGFLESPAKGLCLPLDIRGTAFQRQVWEALRQIPPGTTASYSEIAERIGRPHSVRAVGQACGANRLAVAIPCHRVLRMNGSLSGYRWGLERKADLLQREQEEGATQ
jgi:AraC family transcriptional regulator of adaptative response/methylated-DNA-[protein]-cysteine methyltransferase